MPQIDPSFIPLETLTGGSPQPRYWRSLGDLAGCAEGEPEPDGEDDLGAKLGEGSRRRFLELMGASLGLAGLTGCTRQPTEFIMPYVDPPEHAIPGRPTYFATAVPVDGIAQGVVVETHLGRPTKVEGNRDHPASLGATSVLSQASVLDLYDPDRAREITHLGQARQWDEFISALRQAVEPLRAGKGKGLHILTQTVCSPTLGAQLDAVRKALPEAKWHQYHPTSAHSARAGAQMAFGRQVNTYYRLDRADVVVALDADFLACGQASTRLAHDFAERRRRGDRLDMNRLYAAESAMTSTGGKADHRLPLRWAEVETLARELAAGVGVAGIEKPAGGAHSEWIAAVTKDLTGHRGAGAVIPGEHQSPMVHALAHAMNAALANVGKTVVYTEPVEVEAVDQIASLGELAAAMDAGEAQVLLILGGNPAYNAPADFEIANRLKKVKTVFHLSQHTNETTLLCDWHAPESHFFEDWGDARAFDGTISILQPLIEPLYDSHSSLTVLDAVAQFPARSSSEILRAYWQEHHTGTDFESWWRKSVHDGLISGSALPEIEPALRIEWTRIPAAAQRSGIEVVFRADPYVQGGDYANNTWLQELPHPITKLTWDNAVQLSVATARRLNIESQRVVRLHYRGRTVEGTTWISAGHPDDTVTVHLGFGHTHLGRAANGAGFNAYLLRTSDAIWSGDRLLLEDTGRHYPLASTQMVQNMQGRNLVIESTVDGYRKDPDFVSHVQEKPGPNLSLYPAWNYDGYAWGMSIDLTACVGCNACVIACQAENNTPVVGKEQVLSRRAMHWIRIDTYFKGEAENPAVYYQPVPCMQCEDAPCELVCPVQATNHSTDGLNDMVYNRCIGTRYCSNNCPYKVRRFNFLLFQDWITESIKLQRNPDVSVRSRGVMEKCTYCVQRIREAEIRSEDQDRFIADGEIQTACQQSCPTQAIVFGDINQRDNRVAMLKQEKLNYALLAELNTRPRTTYLAELRNPDPELAQKERIHSVTVEEKQRTAVRPPDPDVSAAVIADGQTFLGVTEQISATPLLRRTIPNLWYAAFGIGMFFVCVFMYSASYLIGKGIGILGNEIPNAWGYPITNFVWWIGIGHAGTLISAFLLLLNQSWRSSINRFAEAMTIFAVVCAGMFPLLHLGRPWLFYWILPYPNTMTIQPQFRSPLVWDVFAVSTYATVSLVFWYLGMIPDLATLRDQSKNKFAYAFYGILSWGWRGASRHWRLHETASLLLAGLATPLVLSVHTVVSFDFTIAILPGWHSTIFPPYFVAGAIYSGFAMVLVLAIPIRAAFGLENLITERHINNCAKLMLTTGLILAYTYVIEPFTAWYSGNQFEMATVHLRAFGNFAWAYWTVIACNVAIPQLLWFRWFRVNTKPLFAISIVVLYGMWLERYMIIVSSLHTDYLPSSWSNFIHTFWDNAILFGSIGVFVTLFALFARFLPMISMYEVKELLPFSRPGGGSEK